MFVMIEKWLGMGSRKRERSPVPNVLSRRGASAGHTMVDSGDGKNWKSDIGEKDSGRPRPKQLTQKLPTVKRYRKRLDVKSRPSYPPQKMLERSGAGMGGDGGVGEERCRRVRKASRRVESSHPRHCKPEPKTKERAKRDPWKRIRGRLMWAALYSRTQRRQYMLTLISADGPNPLDLEAPEFKKMRAAAQMRLILPRLYEYGARILRSITPGEFEKMLSISNGDRRRQRV